jgi:hypothetical protein
VNDQIRTESEGQRAENKERREREFIEFWIEDSRFGVANCQLDIIGCMALEWIY